MKWSPPDLFKAGRQAASEPRAGRWALGQLSLRERLAPRSTPVKPPGPVVTARSTRSRRARVKHVRKPEAPRRDAPAPADPPRGRLEAAAWFLVAAVILAWPRETSAFAWPRLATRSKSGKAVGSGAAESETRGAEALEPGRGRSAQSPAQIPLRGWKDIIWRAWTEFNRDNISQVAGGVAFFGLLAIFPAMAAFVSLYGLFSDVGTAQKQLAVLAGVIPADALTMVGDQMLRLAKARHAGLGVAFIVGLLVSLWSANAGMKALFVGLNIAFEETEKRGFVKLNLVSLAFTFGALIFLILALGAVVVVPVIINFIGYGGGLLPVLRWPLLLLFAVALIASLYRYGPSRQPERWRWVSWGSVIAAILWLAVSLLFSLYVSQFAHYDRTYGSLGAVIGFMSWLWISTTALLFGAELNSEIEHQTAVDTTSGPAAPMGARGARMADTLGEARKPKPAKAKNAFA